MRLVTRTAAGIWLIVAVYFGYLGVTSKPTEGDSLAYHIPIANILMEGKMWDISRYELPWFYYPSTAEAMLGVWMKARLPINLFGWVGWIALFDVVRRVALKRGLGKDMASLLGMAVTLLPTVVRLVPTQTVDIWVGVAWGWLWLVLQEEGRGFKYAAKLGLALGAMIGVKYSGGLFAIVLLIIYGKRLLRNLDLKTSGMAIVIMMAVGGVWYIRNWILTGNPVYPMGAPEFKLTQWMAGMTVFKYPGLFGQALISEFLGWTAVLMLPLFKRNKLVWVGVLNLIIYLVLPSWPENVLSDLRYTYAGFIPLIVGAGEWVLEKKKTEWLTTLATINMAAVLPQLDYKPKLFVGTILALEAWFLRYNRSK